MTIAIPPGGNVVLSAGGQSQRVLRRMRFVLSVGAQLRLTNLTFEGASLTTNVTSAGAHFNSTLPIMARGGAVEVIGSTHDYNDTVRAPFFLHPALLTPLFSSHLLFFQPAKPADTPLVRSTTPFSTATAASSPAIRSGCSWRPGRTPAAPWLRAGL